MSPSALRSFADFPIFAPPSAVDGLSISHVDRTSPATLRAATASAPPIETVGKPANQPEDRGHRMVPDFVTIVYGDCEPSAESGCSTPLQIQIWRSCNRFVDDYEIAPGTPLPHESKVIRGARAAQFDDRLEVYAGSVTIVIFADAPLASRVADLLQPLNAPAKAEAAGRPANELPPTSRGPDCA